MIHQKDKIIKRIEEIFTVFDEYQNTGNPETLISSANEMIDEFNKTSILDFETICSMDDNSFRHFAALETTELDPKKIYVTQLLFLDIISQKRLDKSIPLYKIEKLEMMLSEIKPFESDDVEKLIKLIENSESTKQ